MRGSTYAPTLKSSPTCEMQSTVLTWTQGPTQTRSLLLSSLFARRDRTTPPTLASQLCSNPEHNPASTPAFAPAGMCTPRYLNGPSLHFIQSLLQCLLPIKASSHLPSSNCTLLLSVSSLCFSFRHNTDNYLMPNFHKESKT